MALLCANLYLNLRTEERVQNLFGRTRWGKAVPPAPCPTPARLLGNHDTTRHSESPGLAGCPRPLISRAVPCHIRRLRLVGYRLPELQQQMRASPTLLLPTATSIIRNPFLFSSLPIHDDTLTDLGTSVL